MRYFSLFSGVGGFELGINSAYGFVPEPQRDNNLPPERAGNRGGETPLPSSGGSTTIENQPVSCVGLSEIDKHANAVLKYRFPHIKNYGDITKIDWAGVPDFDLLVGGSPCQDLSIAGKRAGLEGGRSGLFYEYVRCLEEKKPEHFIWENVKGALSSNQGRDFGAVLSALAEAGYSLWWQVLNAKDFGVPQNRERVFIVGSRTGSPREIFFERRDDEETARTGEPLEQGAQSIATRHLGRNGSLTAPHAGAVQVAETPHAIVINRGEPKLTDQANAIDANFHKGFDNHGQRTGVMVDRETARTVRSGGIGSPHDSKQCWDSHIVNGRIRRLTPTECERLMSWPDEWTKFGDYGVGPKEISDTQRYKMCGNGVVSAVVAEVVKAHLL